MARIFPFRSETSPQEGAPRVVDLEGEDADAVFSALSSTTAREIYSHLDAQPGTPSDIADAIDSSIQNVRYHLENLEEAGLVEVVDTWYSSRGNEMSVYATTDGPLILTSDESTAEKLKTAVSRLIGGIGALAGGSLLVQYGATRWLASGTGDAGDTTWTAPAPDEAQAPETADEPTDDADEDVEVAGVEEETADDEPVAAEDAPDIEPSADDLDFEAYDAVPDAGPEAADPVFALPPGLLFFLGGLVVLLAGTWFWYWYRPAY
ncbi:ArsR/SmtB family transcription factor [Natronobacterium gregoryi]|uniref:Transcriptional regulator n=2 Tax=Natronobacterium gregoryi TaxID=44930 RepID=L0AKI9_NATGS|nr:helix-turn-helix domain-containing protein [Natronobacterium gregoryi]AFZ74316.1 putative transcriptional regulator [Natronobacterium gregoryi SP2]ELY63548.1 regulatory protein ArsR [Natronobacterium gregoryi SP2]PLK22174.1 ArsR family transcriptional regulator [Natronobacterium gregoryi SP2]SFI53577.1 transcriptional regulator, ArsR family [Natronobacterium gregoryi]